MSLRFARTGPNVGAMRYAIPILLAAALTVAGAPAGARCFADYKAKQDEPLRLHYGVVELQIEPCEMSADIEADVARRIGVDGWTLLQITSVFGEDELGAKQGDAGDYFLRY